jgi:hypothetical protein
MQKITQENIDAMVGGFASNQKSANGWFDSIEEILESLIHEIKRHKERFNEEVERNLHLKDAMGDRGLSELLLAVDTLRNSVMNFNISNVMRYYGELKQYRYMLDWNNRWMEWNVEPLTEEQIIADNLHFIGPINYDAIEEYKNAGFPQYSRVQVVSASTAKYGICKASYLWDKNEHKWFLGAN